MIPINKIFSIIGTKKFKNILEVLGIVLLCIFLIFLNHYYKKYNIEKENNKKLESTISNLRNNNSSQIYYKIKWKNDTINASIVSSLYLDKSNLKKELSDKNKYLKELKIKIKDLTSQINQSFTIHDTIKSIAYIDSFKSIHTEYIDSFTTIKVTINKDLTSNIIYNSNEIYDLYNYINYKHHFLFFRWGKEEKYLLFPYNPRVKAKIKAISVIKN